jgi:ribosome-associated protein
MLEDLLKKALQKPKKRIKTKPSRSSKLKRLQKKKQHSDKKKLRKKPKL